MKTVGHDSGADAKKGPDATMPDAPKEDARPDAKEHVDGHVKRDGAKPDARKDSGEDAGVDARKADAAKDSGEDSAKDAREDHHVRHDAEPDGHEHDAREDVRKDGEVADGRDDVVKDAKSDVHDVAVDSFVCDSAGVPATEPCVISEPYGVFVAPAANGGDDADGTGTRDKPFATVGHAIGVASVSGTRVYVCGATYAESLVVTSAVSVYGGLACPEGTGRDGGGAKDAAVGGGEAWRYTAVLAVIAPAGLGYALDVESVSGAIFEDMGFVALGAPPALGDAGAPDAGDAGADAADAEAGSDGGDAGADGGVVSVVPGTSSIAVMVNASHGVSFTRVSVTAGAGAAGASAGVLVSNACATSLDGVAAPAGGGGTTPVSCTCPIFGSSKAGAGGADNETGGPGSAVPAIVGVAPNDGLGGAGAGAAHCGDGDNGADGVAASGGGAAGGAGSLSATGWSVVGGAAGGIGDPGEGGGGGGGGDSLGGAGGGAGGCGGNGGGPGSGGGASIAVVAVSSAVSLSSSTLVTGAGGPGGAGAAGEEGQAGGTGGSDGTSECYGGNGGDGAGGGGGGGGAGGPSVGIASTGTSTVTVDGAELTSAATLPGPSVFQGGGGGTVGSGGAAGVGVDGNDGNAGGPGPAGAAAAVAGF
jgi:hypothetical protein